MLLIMDRPVLQCIQLDYLRNKRSSVSLVEGQAYLLCCSAHPEHFRRLVLPQMPSHGSFYNRCFQLIEDVVVVFSCLRLGHQLVELLHMCYHYLFSFHRTSFKVSHPTSTDLTGSWVSVHCFSLMSTVVLKVPVLLCWEICLFVP